MEVNTSESEVFNVTIEGLELQFELVENTYNNSNQLLNDTQVIQENQVVIGEKFFYGQRTVSNFSLMTNWLGLLCIAVLILI